MLRCIGNLLLSHTLSQPSVPFFSSVFSSCVFPRFPRRVGGHRAEHSRTESTNEQTNQPTAKNKKQKKKVPNKKRPETRRNSPSIIRIIHIITNRIQPGRIRTRVFARRAAGRADAFLRGVVAVVAWVVEGAGVVLFFVEMGLVLVN